MSSNQNRGEGEKPPSSSSNFNLANYLEDYMEERDEETEEDGALHDVYSELEKKERDLIMAAELGKALLNNNEDLRRKNAMLMEEFQQKIHELEQEKVSLKVKLDAVECDYDIQMKELQTDIVQLREEVKKQRVVSLEGDRETTEKLNQLSQQNEALVDRLHQVNGLEDQMRDKRTSMYDHLHQLEVLRDEITYLHSEKEDLEQRLSHLTEERDNLISTLDESQDRIMLLERHTQDQHSTIYFQEQEIAELQETAAGLQERLNHLTLVQQEQQDRTPSSVGGGSSLLAELADSMDANMPSTSNHASDTAQRPGTLWWASGLVNGTPELGDYEDDFELDDDAPMYSQISDLSGSGLRLGAEGVIDAEDGDSSFIRELRNEVLEVYHQLRHMYADLSVHKRSTGAGKTPVELALVEMDFRLGSLRNVVGELKGLLNDLMPYDETTANPPPPSISSGNGFSLTSQPSTSSSGAQNSSQSYQSPAIYENGADNIHSLSDELNMAQQGQINNNDNHLLQQAIDERNKAIERRAEVEGELNRMQTDIAKLNDQLLMACHQKSTLSQQLEDWQDDMFKVMDQRIQQRIKEEALPTSN